MKHHEEPGPEQQPQPELPKADQFSGMKRFLHLEQLVIESPDFSIEDKYALLFDFVNKVQREIRSEIYENASQGVYTETFEAFVRHK
jgi:hypothetical protein